MWKRLSNPNTLPLIGAYMRGSELVMVSEWMKNGNIKQYLQQNPRANKLSMVNSSPKIFLLMHMLTSQTVGGRCARSRIFAQYEYRPRGS